MCDSPVQGALRNRSDLHAAELHKMRDKQEPRLVKGRAGFEIIKINELFYPCNKIIREISISVNYSINFIA